MITALTGPESTGKSQTAKALAGHFNGLVVEEVARRYLQELGRPYRENDLLEIARLQCAEEDRLLKTSSMLFCDTTLLVIKVWSYFKYGRCHPWIEEESMRRKYSLHLLCHIDVPWMEDPLREHEHRREELFDIYHRELMESGEDYEILTGSGEARLKRAILYVSLRMRA